MPQDKLSVEEFAKRIRDKAQAYENVDDSTLVSKYLEKYPVYKDRVDLDSKKKDQALSEDVGVSSEESLSEAPSTSQALEEGSIFEKKKGFIKNLINESFGRTEANFDEKVDGGFNGEENKKEVLSRLENLETESQLDSIYDKLKKENAYPDILNSEDNPFKTENRVKKGVDTTEAKILSEWETSLESFLNLSEKEPETMSPKLAMETGGKAKRIQELKAAIPSTKDSNERERLRGELSSLLEAQKDKVYYYDGSIVSREEHERKIEGAKNSLLKKKEIVSDIVDREVGERVEAAFNNTEENSLVEKSSEKFLIADKSAAGEYANQIAKKYGLEEDGQFSKLIKRETIKRVENKIDEPKRKEYAAEKLGMPPDEFLKSKNEGLINKVVVDEEQALEEEVSILAEEYKEKANNDFAKKSASIIEEQKTLNEEFENFQQSIINKKESLDERYQSGNISESEYLREIERIKDKAKSEEDAYKEAFEEKEKEFFTLANETDAKWNNTLNNEIDSAATIANKNIKEKLGELQDSGYSEETINKLREAYNYANKKIYEEKEKRKQGVDRATMMAPMGLGTLKQFYRTTYDRIGGMLAGWGAFSNSPALEQFGETMTEVYNPHYKENKSWYDLLNPEEIAENAGALVGSMLPSMVAAFTVAKATGGLGAGVGWQLLTSAFTSFLGESASMSGNMYRDVYRETGDEAEARDKADKVFKSQLAIMPLFAFDTLPIVGKSLNLIKKPLLRIATGGAIELVTETAQETFQQSFEELIKDDKEASISAAVENITPKKIKNNLIATSGAALIGVGGQSMQIANENYSEQQRNAAFAKNKDLKEQFSKYSNGQRKKAIYDIMNSHGEEKAIAFINYSFQNGLIDKETLSQEMDIIKETKRIEEASKELGFNETQKSIYSSLVFKKKELQERANNSNDEVVIEKRKKEIEEVDTEINNLVNTGKANLIAVQYTMDVTHMTRSEFDNAMKDEKFREGIRNGDIQVGFTGEVDGELASRVEAEQQQGGQPEYIIDGKKFKTKQEFLNELEKHKGKEKSPVFEVNNDPQTSEEAFGILAGKEAQETGATKESISEKYDVEIEDNVDGTVEVEHKTGNPFNKENAAQIEAAKEELKKAGIKVREKRQQEPSAAETTEGEIGAEVEERINKADKFNSVTEKVNKGEAINENELSDAIDEAYELLAELENDNSQDARTYEELIEDEIQKLESYENVTTTETRKVAEAKTVQTTKKTPRKTTPSKEKDFVGKKVKYRDNKGGGASGVVTIMQTPDGREYYVLDTGERKEVTGAKVTKDGKTRRRVEPIEDDKLRTKVILGEVGKTFNNATINYDQDGNPTSVTVQSSDGKQITIQDSNIAKEFYIEQAKQEEYDEDVFEETYIEFVGEEEVEVRKRSEQKTQKDSKYGKDNKIVTEEAKNKALERLRKKRGNMKSGIDPEEMKDAIIVAGYHIESGARKFGDFAKRMIDDLGDSIKPHLKSIYEEARSLPNMGSISKEMTPKSEVENANIDEIIDGEQEAAQEEYLTPEDVVKKGVIQDLDKNRAEGEYFRGIEYGELIPERPFYISESAAVAADYMRRENTSGKYYKMSDKYNPKAKLKKYKLSNNAKILDTTSISGANELRKILGREPVTDTSPNWMKSYNLLDNMSKADTQKIIDAGYDGVRVFETDRDRGIDVLSEKSIAIINKDVITGMKTNIRKEETITDTPPKGKQEQPQEEAQEEAQEEVVPEEYQDTEAVKEARSRGEIISFEERVENGVTKARFTLKVGEKEVVYDKAISEAEGRVNAPKKPTRKQIREEAEAKELSQEEYDEYRRKKEDEYNEATRAFVEENDGVTFKTKKGDILRIKGNRVLRLNENGKFVDYGVDLSKEGVREVFTKKIKQAFVVDDSAVQEAINERKGEAREASRAEQEARSKSIDKISDNHSKKKAMNKLKDQGSGAFQTIEEAVAEAMNAIREAIIDYGFASPKRLIEAAIDAFENTEWFRMSENPATSRALVADIIAQEINKARTLYKKEYSVDYKKSIKNMLNFANKKANRKFDFVKDLKKVLDIINSEKTDAEKQEALAALEAEALNLGNEDMQTIISDLYEYNQLTEEKANDLLDGYRTVVTGEKKQLRGEHGKYKQKVKDKANKEADNTNISEEELATGNLSDKNADELGNTFASIVRRYLHIDLYKKRDLNRKQFSQKVRGMFARGNFSLPTLFEALDGKNENFSKRKMKEIANAVAEEKRLKRQNIEEIHDIFAENAGLSEFKNGEIVKRMNFILDALKEGADKDLNNELVKLQTKYRENKIRLTNEYRRMNFALFTNVIKTFGKTIRLDEGASYIMNWEQEITRKQMIRDRLKSMGVKNPEALDESNAKDKAVIDEAVKAWEDDIQAIKERIDAVYEGASEFLPVIVRSVMDRVGMDVAVKYRVVAGKPLDMRDNYFPIIRSWDDVELEGRSPVNSGIATFLSKRLVELQRSKRTMKYQSDEKGSIGIFDILDGFLKDSQHFLAFADLSQEMNEYVKDPRVKARIRYMYGEDGHDLLVYLMRSALNQSHLNEHFFMNQSPLTKMLKSITNNILISTLRGSLKFIFTQGASDVVASTEYSGTKAEYWKDYAKIINPANRKFRQRLKARLKGYDPVFAERAERMSQHDPDMGTSISAGTGASFTYGLKDPRKTYSKLLNVFKDEGTKIGKLSSRYNRFKDWTGIPLMYGDIKAIVNGYGLNFLADERRFGTDVAISNFRLYNGTQQDRTGAWLTRPQLKAREAQDILTFLGYKSFTAYQSVGFEYINKEMQAVMRLKKSIKEGGFGNTKKKDWFDFSMYHFIGSAKWAVINNITSVIEYVLSGFEDDEKLDKLKQEMRWYAILGSYSYWFIAGGALKYVIDKSYDIYDGKKEPKETFKEAAKHMMSAQRSVGDAGGVDFFNNIQRYSSESIKGMEEESIKQSLVPIGKIIATMQGMPADRMSRIAEGTGEIKDEIIENYGWMFDGIGAEDLKYPVSRKIAAIRIYNRVIENYESEYHSLSESDKEDIRFAIYQIVGYSEWVTLGGRKPDDSFFGASKPIPASKPISQ